MKPTLILLALLAIGLPAACHAQIGPADPFSALAGYQSSTGHLWISVSDLGVNWYIESEGNLTGAAPQLPTISGALNLDNDSRVGQASFVSRLNYTDVDLGPVAIPGLTPEDFFLKYSVDLRPELSGWLVSIPPTGAPRLGSVNPNSAVVGYNPLTGDLLVSANRIYSWQLQSTAALDAAAAVFPAVGGDTQVVTREPHRVAAAFASGNGNFSYPNHYLGRIAPVGLPLSNFTLHYKTSDTGPEILGEVVLLVPEPGGLTLTAATAIAGLGYGRRRRRG